jgi:hypothetical protein
MKITFRHALNIFAFALFVFAIYLNFFYKGD